MADTEPHDAFVESFVAKFDGRSREIAESQLAQATGDAREAWAAVVAALDARDAKPSPTQN